MIVHGVSRAEARDHTSPRWHQPLQLFLPVQHELNARSGVDRVAVPDRDHAGTRPLRQDVVDGSDIGGSWIECARQGDRRSEGKPRTGRDRCGLEPTEPRYVEQLARF